MVLYVVDPFQESHFNVLNRELEISGMRLNEARPPVFVKRTDRGGIIVRSTCEQTHLENEEVRDIVRSFGIVSAHVTMRIDATADHIVDTMAANRVYSKAIVVVNKMDIASEKDLTRTTAMLPDDWPVMPISAYTGMGVEDMKDFLYDNLGFMSVFLKPQGQEADLEEPLIVKDTSTVEDVCNSLHRDFVRKFRYARVRGPSAKFDWQRVGLAHQLKDGDLLSIIIKR
jgi:hypothetical protein